MSTRWEQQNSRIYFEVGEIELRANDRAPRIIYTALMYDRVARGGGGWDHVLLAEGWGVSDEAAAMADAMKNHAANRERGLRDA